MVQTVRAPQLPMITSNAPQGGGSSKMDQQCGSANKTSGAFPKMLPSLPKTEKAPVKEPFRCSCIEFGR